MKWLLFLALVLMVIRVTSAPTQEQCSPDPAVINALFEKDIRGEIYLDAEAIQLLQSLEPHINWGGE